jgi:hypothetical protein
LYTSRAGAPLTASSRITLIFQTNGITGPVGPQGLIGPTGPIGPQGIQGLTGATGPQGIQGPSGPQGIQGLTGPQGIQGLTGATGPQGIQGITGPSGPQGIQGLNGTSFIYKGEYSSSISYNVNDVVYYNGSSYICILSSFNNLPTNILYFNLIALKGDPGIQGIQGLTGPTGPTGPKGDTGANGKDGDSSAAAGFATAAGVSAGLSAGSAAASLASASAAAASATAAEASATAAGISASSAETAKNEIESKLIHFDATPTNQICYAELDISNGTQSRIKLNPYGTSEFLNDCQFNQNLITNTIINNGSNTLNLTAANTLNISSSTIINLTAPLINIGNSNQAGTVYINGLIIEPLNNLFNSFSSSNGYLSQNGI